MCAGVLVNRAFAGISPAIALLTRREATMIAVANFSGLPLLFLSTTMIARAQMPGWMPLIGLMAYISLNLGIFNLLPIPILDGGMILFLIIETIMRRDVNQQLNERVYQVAFVCLLAFFDFVIFNDITNLNFFTKLKP